MQQLQIFSGFSAIGQGLIYIFAFLYFGVFWVFPYGESPSQIMLFMRDNQLSFSAITFFMYIVFGCLLAILVAGINQRLRWKQSILIQVATIFGCVWVGLVVASGMISNVGLDSVLALAIENPQKAIDAWSVINILVESLGGGNELIGGLWVLLLSVAAIRVQEFSWPLNSLGIFVGSIGVLTIYPAEILTEIFGVSQIVWFFWLGTVLLRNPELGVSQDVEVVS